MTTWKILITDGLEENGLEILRKAGDVDNKPGISADDLIKVIDQYDALIVRGRTKVTAAVFDAGAKLKVVGRSGVGVDNIDLVSAREHNVTVVNAPIATSLAVAELAMALMLAVAREIPRADATMKQNQWIKKELEGTELSTKTLGIIGFGRIGGAVAVRAAAFGMKILAFDPFLDKDGVVSRGGQAVTFDELLAQSDFITMHIPLTAETRGLINAEALAKMKDGVYIICAARGGVIDEAALLDALNAGKVAGAGLDVFTTEPPGESALVSHPRVVCTPHIGGQTVEAQGRAANDISNEVVACLEGKPLRWKVA